MTLGAWEYANILKPNLESLTTEDLEYIGEYFYNTESRHISRPVKKKIEYAVETIEAKLIKYIREENNLEIVYEALGEIPLISDIMIMLFTFAISWNSEKIKNNTSLQGYLFYLHKFPDAAQVEKAMHYGNKLAFEQAVQVNTVQAYTQFMSNIPRPLNATRRLKKSDDWHFWKPAKCRGP